MPPTKLTRRWTEYMAQREKLKEARDLAYDAVREAVEQDGRTLRSVAEECNITHQAVDRIVHRRTTKKADSA